MPVSPEEKPPKLLRRLAERFSRGIVFKRNLPKQFHAGKIFVSPDAGLKYLRFDYSRLEPVLFRMASELVREGDVVWDIGANVGLFAFAAAGQAGARGQVVALEPDPWLASLLRRSAALDTPPRARVTVIAAAASDSLSLAQLHVAARARASNYLDGGGSTQTGGSRETQTVVTVTLDWLLDHLPAPQVVKIDVEGVEDRVLLGARRLLTTVKPKIWCEVCERNRLQVTQLLRDSGYGLYSATEESSGRVPLRRAAWDTLALPIATMP